MKKLFTLLAACLILVLPASSAVYKKTLISETFALCTQGSIETPTTENIYDATTGEIFSQYLTTPGWHFVTQTGEVSTNALTQAGGAAYVESSYNAMLQSPTLKWGGSTDGQVTVTFDALPVGETTSIRFDLRTNASGKKQVAAEFTAGEWSTVSVTHSISGDEGTIRLNGGEAFYIRNLVVTINAEALGLSGTYDFASTVSVVNEGTWSDLAVANFTFDVEANTGEDAEQYPYIVKNFLPFNMATGNAPHDLKAFYGPDGNLVIQGGCNAAHYLYGESNEQYHLCLFDGKGYAGGNGQIALSKTAEGYTVADGITAVRHSKYDWGFMSDDTPIDLVRYTDIAITRPKVVGYDEFVGTYNITGTRNAESLVDLSRPKGWKVLDGEGTFDIELNTGDDAEQFPLILKGFLGTPDFTVNDLKARVVNGQLSIPQGKNISLQGSSPRAFLCTTTEETSTYTATEDDIVLVADAEGNLVPSATVAVGYHEDAEFIFPETNNIAYIYSSLVISKIKQPEPADVVGTYNISGTRNAESLVDLSAPKGWKFLDGEGTFSVELNSGEDADTYPLILKGFLGTPEFEVNDIKARFVDGKISIPQGKGVSLKGTNPCAFLGTTTEETNVYTATTDDIVLVADAEGNLIPSATVAVGYHEDAVFIFPETNNIAYIYSSLVISKIKQPEPADFVGDYTVTGTRNAESLVDLSAPKGWKFLDGEGTFSVELNSGEDADTYPLILKGFLGTPEFEVNDIKARFVDGKISIPQGKGVSLKGTNPCAFLGTTTEETNVYTATTDDIVLVADAEGNLIPSATVAVGYHEDAVFIFPETNNIAYIYSSLVIAPKGSEEVKPNTTTQYFTAPELRDEVANIGQALIGVLNVTTTADKYVTETLRSSEASADGTLAGVRAPQEEEVFEVLAVEGGYVLRHHNAAEGEGYLGLNGNTFTAADQAGATVWTILGPDEEGYGSVTSFDDIYPDIAAELNPNMVRFITQGQYLNGQNFENIGGIRGGTGAWSFNYIRNANYEEEEPTPTPEPIVFTDQLTVTVNDVSGTLDASVNLIKHEDGTIDFSLPNFVLAYGEDVMPVGNININGLTLVPGEEYDTFEYNDMLAITAGDLEGIDFWMGPALGEMPLKLQGKVNFDDHKLFVNIDIDLTESLAQIINVKFGTDFEEPAPYVGPAKNQLFTASTPQRGGWMNVDGALKGTLQGGASVETDATDANQLFALVDYEGKTYLWNEGAQHFLNDAGQFVSILTATPIYCTEEAGYEGVCDKTYFFHFSEEKNINLGGSKQIIIDDWSEADAGNMMVINAAEGFDAEAVAAVIKADTSLAVTNITWTITDGEGNEIATETQTQCEEGKEYTVQFSLYGVELKGETTVVAGKEDQNITLVAEFTGTLPVEYAATLDAVEHWYALRLHSNQQHWLYSDEGTLAFGGEEAQTDEYAWALVGDPLRGFQLYNKALGAAAALDAANPCTLSEDGLTARFYVHPTAEANHVDDGFCLKAYGESQYLNYQGGAIKRWGAADAGSTFVFDEIVEIPDGINGVSANQSLSTRYNLQGQQVGTAFRGIYLQNRKKVLVK